MNIYFDTSSWNCLVEHPKREKLVIQLSNYRVLASVISVSEVLRTSDDLKRQQMCSVMQVLHGDGPLLERSYNELARDAAQGILQGQEDFQLTETEEGKYLRACMSNATPPPIDEICTWHSNVDDNIEQFILAIRPPQPDLTTCYLSTEFLSSEALLGHLCQFPSVADLSLSASQMRIIYQQSDVWQALGATLAYIINLSTTHAPKNKNRGKRPGGRDLWQAAYLGVVEIFVTSDGPMLETVSKISALMLGPRLVLSTKDFFEHLLAADNRT